MVILQCKTQELYEFDVPKIHLSYFIINFKYMKIKQLKHFRPATFCFWKHLFYLHCLGISWLFALVFLLLGIGLLLESLLHYKIFLDTVAQNYILCLMRTALEYFYKFGMALIDSRFCFGAMIYICKMVW